MKILKLSMVLLIICAIVAGILGVVNFVTADTIAARQAEKTAKAYAAVLPSEGYTQLELDAEQFPKMTISEANGGEGYVVMSTFSGSQGNITMVTGVDNELRCTGISIISHSETSGLGANAASSAGRARFASAMTGTASSFRAWNSDTLMLTNFAPSRNSHFEEVVKSV